VLGLVLWDGLVLWRLLLLRLHERDLCLKVSDPYRLLGVLPSKAF
jgi:hypothetical protein